ncbi:MAG: tetratricopeptide repeat protein [Thermaurantimonas sp.]
MFSVTFCTKVIGQEISRLHAAGQYERVMVYGGKVDSLRGDEAMLVADAYFRKRNPERAEEILTTIIRRGYTTEEAHWQLAQVLMAREKWLPALEQTEKALQFDRKNFIYLKTRAGLLLQLGRYREAEAEYKNLIRIRPGDESLYWLTYQSIAEQEDYRRGKNYLLTHVQKFKTPQYQNKAFDALARTYHYTLKKPDSALYIIQRWKTTVGKNTQNVQLELLVLTYVGKFQEALNVYNSNKNLFSKSKDGILFDEISGHREFSLQVFYDPDKSSYTVYLMDSEMQYFQGKIEWNKNEGNKTVATIALRNQTSRKHFPFSIDDYQNIRTQSIQIAKSVNNLE